MRRFSAIIFALSMLAAAPAPATRESGTPEPLTPQAISELSLDELFEKLPAYAGSRAGKAIEAKILERFNESGSPTADLLFSWALKAIDEENYPQALDILDQVILVKPDFAEGWNKRATVHYILDDYSASLADIRQTLAIEPRHFGALSGLGMIMQVMDRKEDAVRAFRRALEIDPQLDKVRESLERLEKETAGDSI
jgi:tetratricopeptide (TPR) repeat protein